MKITLKYPLLVVSIAFDAALTEKPKHLHVLISTLLQTVVLHQNILIRPSKTTCVVTKRKYPSDLSSIVYVKPNIWNEYIKLNINSALRSFLYQWFSLSSIAKLETFGLNKPILNLVNDYLGFRIQRTKIGSSFSDWAIASGGVPEGSILGPLLFNILVNLFLFIEKPDICKFTGENLFFSCGGDLSVILKSLEHVWKFFLRWFNLNSLKTGPGKSQYMILEKSLKTRYCLLNMSIIVILKVYSG